MDLLMSTYNLVLIIFGFGILIFFHELGHFLSAKWAGIRTEAFAVGMGWVVFSWRKGIGLRIGSTAKAYNERVRQFVSTDDIHRKSDENVEDAFNRLSDAEKHRIADKLGLGETEYSLRLIPIGGFVKMLGQDDIKPDATSDDPRSYNSCSIGKRMVVVSAGVIMNVILALIMFIIAFQVGVKFPAPVIGDVSSTSPAGTTLPLNAEELNVTEPGLQPGDRVTHIDDKQIHTFADITIASAMSKPDDRVALHVQRAGIDMPLIFKIKPEKNPATGLLGIGVAPGSSNRLLGENPQNRELVEKDLSSIGLLEAGVEPGMQLIEAQGQSIETLEQLHRIAAESGGKPIASKWQFTNEDQESGVIVSAEIPVEPEFQILHYPERSSDEKRDYEMGLLGLVPLITVEEVSPTSGNLDILQEGDVILNVGYIQGPRGNDLRQELKRFAKATVPMTVLRNGREVKVEASVNREGMLGVLRGYAWDLPIVSRVMGRVAFPEADGQFGNPVRTMAADHELGIRFTINAVNDTPVNDWQTLRAALRHHTQSAHNDNTSAEITLALTQPTPDNPQETVTLTLSEKDVQDLHALSWTSTLPPWDFEPVNTVLSSEGNPITAIVMGFKETHKFMVNTYLTLDRLFRGTVPVDQLRGPVGIIQIGTKVADRGMMYLLFFLAMISVNLAVLNFLPIPIVDGGLFLFLIYEKLKGKPPSPAFQNAAFVVGLCLIGGLLLLVTYNDIARLFTGG